MKKEQNELLLTWDSDLRIICHSHYDASVSSSKKHYILGILTIVLTAIVGTTIFSTIQKNSDLKTQITTGILSFFAVVFASLQTFLKLSEKAEKHRTSGAKFGSLLKELEHQMVLKKSASEFEQWSNSFRKRWDDISIQCPTVPKKIWKKRLTFEKKQLAKKLNK